MRDILSDKTNKKLSATNQKNTLKKDLKEKLDKKSLPVVSLSSTPDTVFHSKSAIFSPNICSSKIELDFVKRTENSRKRDDSTNYSLDEISDNKVVNDEVCSEHIKNQTNNNISSVSDHHAHLLIETTKRKKKSTILDNEIQLKTEHLADTTGDNDTSIPANSALLKNLANCQILTPQDTVANQVNSKYTTIYGHIFDDAFNPVLSKCSSQLSVSSSKESIPPIASKKTPSDIISDKSSVISYLTSVYETTSDYNLKYDLSKCIEILRGVENIEVRELHAVISELVDEKDRLERENELLIIENDDLRAIKNKK